MNNRKRQVIQSSLELFTEKGFQNTSIQDILNHANISKGTFYNYFSSKTECFMAILEQSRYETSLRRHEILIGKDSSDLDILAQQITVLFQINREQNLFSVFEGIFHSGDIEMKKLIAHHRLYEVQWISERLIDVFGEESRPYTYECATIFFGISQHLAMSYRSTHNVQPDALELVRTSLRHLSAVLLEMIQTKKIMLTADNIQILRNKIGNKKVTKEQLTERLTGFLERLHAHDPHPVGEQFTLSLLEEFSKDEPRLAVIEVLLKAYHEAFLSTSHEPESKELANYMWYLVKQEK